MSSEKTVNLDFVALRHLFDGVDTARTLDDQLQGVLDQIQRILHVSVCSLYLLDNGTLSMQANRGLAVGQVGPTLLADEGLVGLVASTQLPMNLNQASVHPNFKHIPGLQEEQYDAFLGVALVNRGQTVGVLIVQDAPPRRFRSEEETFLLTVAAYLSGKLLRTDTGTLPTSINDTRPRGFREHIISGKIASPGIAIGRLHVVLDHMTLQLTNTPGVADTSTELAEFKQAVEITIQEVMAARDQLSNNVSEDVLTLFDFYRLLLEGDDLVAPVKLRIEGGESAFSAVGQVVDSYLQAFGALSNDYIKARAEDVAYIGQQLLANLLGQAAEAKPAAENTILIGNFISVADIARYDANGLRGIICLQGSSLSHTAVLANALGIPAVMGIGAIENMKEGDEVIIDGDSGIVIVAPGPFLIQEYRKRIESANILEQELAELRDVAAETRDGIQISLMANTGLLSDVTPGLARGAQGIGLYRSEIPFLSHSKLPTEDEQFEIYRSVLGAYHPLPVVMRLLDIGGDKQLPYLTITEDNPSLGWRGIRFLLDNRPIFSTQLRAMLRASVEFDNLSLMLPMVMDCAEVTTVIEFLDRSLTDLANEGIIVQRPLLGVMIEVPAVVSQLRELSALIDFASIGTNDLTQYLLAVDRNNEYVASQYDQMHPAVVACLKEVTEIATEKNLPLSICGELAAQPEGAALLIGLGFRTLSMNASKIPLIKQVIHQLSAADTADWLSKQKANLPASELRERLRMRLEK